MKLDKWDKLSLIVLMLSIITLAIMHPIASFQAIMQMREDKILKRFKR